MKKNIFLISLLSFVFSSFLFSQVIISSDLSQPDSSAMFEVRSIDRGFLPPRMTITQRMSISNPAEGLMVYCTNCGPGRMPAITVFMRGSWRNLMDCTPPAFPQSSENIEYATAITWKWHAVPGATGYWWGKSSDTLLIDLGPDTSYTETDLDCLTEYARYVWAYNNCGVSSPALISSFTSFGAPSAPAEAVHIPALTQVLWKWAHTEGAAGYKWSINPDSVNATNVGSDTSYAETGLDCDSSYIRHVWAYNACGISDETVLIQSTSIDTIPMPAEGTHIPSASQIIWNWEQVSEANGYKWNDTNDYISANDLGEQTTFTETGLECQTQHTSYVWSYNNCGYSFALTITDSTLDVPLAGAPAPSNHFSTPTSIQWKWHPYAGANGYRWNTSNNYSSAIDLVADTSYTENNLACGTQYTRYVWAYDSCGFSASPAAMTKSTVNCWACGDTLYISHVVGNVAPVNKNTTYGTVNNVPGINAAYCWITSNLGSNHQATSVSDTTEASAGWYWQFNRMQGYKHNNLTRTPNTTWITVISEYSDWVTANDPCTIELGTGWRLPTSTEYSNLDGTNGWNTWNGPWGSVLKMHAAGDLLYSSGNLDNRGVKGYYWSSTASSQYTYMGQDINFAYNACSISIHQKAYAFSVRCLKDY
jgi:hypothetical protein